MAPGCGVAELRVNTQPSFKHLIFHIPISHLTTTNGAYHHMPGPSFLQPPFLWSLLGKCIKEVNYRFLFDKDADGQCQGDVPIRLPGCKMYGWFDSSIPYLFFPGKTLDLFFNGRMYTCQSFSAFFFVALLGGINKKAYKSYLILNSDPDDDCSNIYQEQYARNK